MRLLLKKLSKDTLILIDAIDIEEFQLLPNGEQFEVAVTIDRQLNFHRKFRGFINTVYNTIHESLDRRYPTAEVFYKEILYATGKYTFIENPDGTKDIKLGSTAFDNMDEIEYKVFVRDTIRLISKDYFDLGNEKGLMEVLEKYNYY